MPLFKETKKEEKVKAEKRIVRFNASGIEYAVSIERIKEIIYAKAVHPLPGAMEGIEGVINLRGAVVPVIDSRKKFKAAVPPGVPEHILIVEVRQQKIGLIVDCVNEVMAVREDQIQKTESFMDQNAAYYVEGIYRVGERLIVLLNLEQLWTAAETSELETLSQTTLNGADLSPQNKRKQ